jgi:uncharacterized protein (TIGR00369 family)
MSGAATRREQPDIAVDGMTSFDPLARVRRSFAGQAAMETIGATLQRVAPGEVEIVMPMAPHVTQQHGFVHGGVVGMIADSACGFSALSTMEADTAVLTAEFKINFLSPAAGERLIARGRVVKGGRTLILTMAEVEAETGGERKLVAMMTATMMCVRGRGIVD